MLINSIDFLIFFLGVVVIYRIVPRRLRYVWLLIVSYVHYMSWSPRYAVILAFSTLVTWGSGLFIRRYERNRRLQALCIAGSVVLNLGILGIFKYSNFVLSNLNHIANAMGLQGIHRQIYLALPVGISFYTFRVISYTIDVYRGRLDSERNLLRYALYVSFFPQIVSGPIERAGNLLPQIRDLDKMNLRDGDCVGEGLTWMLWGFFQKLIIADRAALLVNTVLGDYTSYGFVEISIAVILYTIQIYCDFDGYTNMARGAARVMGFETMRNFRQPYLATSIKDFWRRWHISLTSWFTEYLYIPLGGNRKGTTRKYINIVIVFALSGLWHGAAWNFIAWGLLHAVYQIIGDLRVRFCKKGATGDRTQPAYVRIPRMVGTFLLVAFAWILFACDGMGQAIGVIRQMFTVSGKGNDLLALGLDAPNWIVLIIGIVILLAVDIIHEREISITSIVRGQRAWIQLAIYMTAVWVIILFGIYGVAYDASTFIYAQF